jgi:hypothetical protein
MLHAMRTLGSLVVATAACGALLSCSNASEDKAGGLLLLPQGPGLASSNAAVGVPFMMAAAVFSLPGGSCGSGPCPAGAEKVTVTAASCGAGECTVTLTPGGATFEVLPTRAGMVTVHAEARGDSGTRYGGDAQMTFGTSAHLEVRNDGSNLAPLLDRTKYAVLPGAQLHWQLTLEDDAGHHLAAEGEQLTATFDGGDVFTADLQTTGQYQVGMLAVTAKSPGKATLHLALGAITRDFVLVVEEPARVTGASFHALTLAYDAKGVLATSLTGPDVVGQPVSSLMMKTYDLGAAWALVLETSDGQPTLGGASTLALTPSTLGETADYASGSEDDGILVVSHAKPGTGTVTGTIGAAKVSIPFTVAP